MENQENTPNNEFPWIAFLAGAAVGATAAYLLLKLNENKNTKAVLNEWMNKGQQFYEDWKAKQKADNET